MPSYLVCSNATYELGLWVGWYQARENMREHDFWLVEKCCFSPIGQQSTGVQGVFSAQNQNNKCRYLVTKWLCTLVHFIGCDAREWKYKEWRYSHHWRRKTSSKGKSRSSFSVRIFYKIWKPLTSSLPLPCSIHCFTIRKVVGVKLNSCHSWRFTHRYFVNFISQYSISISGVSNYQTRTFVVFTLVWIYTSRGKLTTCPFIRAG